MTFQGPAVSACPLVGQGRLGFGLGHLVEPDRAQAPSPVASVADGPPAADSHIDLADRAAGCSLAYAGTQR